MSTGGSCELSESASIAGAKNLRILVALALPAGLTGAPQRLLMLSEEFRSRGGTVGILGDPGDQFVREASRRGFEIVELPRDEVLSRSNVASRQRSLFFKAGYVWHLLKSNLKVAALVVKWRANVVLIRGTKGMVFWGPGLPF